MAYSVTTFSSGSHIRMKWRLPEWEEPSIVQIRVLRAAGGRTTVAFHQEGLKDRSAREAMLSRWESVHERLDSLFDIDS